MTTKHVKLRDHRCEGTNMAYICQIFDALVVCICTNGCTISKDIGINEEKEIGVSNNESTIGHM